MREIPLSLVKRLTARESISVKNCMPVEKGAIFSIKKKETDGRFCMTDGELNWGDKYIRNRIKEKKLSVWIDTQEWLKWLETYT